MITTSFPLTLLHSVQWFNGLLVFGLPDTFWFHSSEISTFSGDRVLSIGYKIWKPWLARFGCYCVRVLRTINHCESIVFCYQYRSCTRERPILQFLKYSHNFSNPRDTWAMWVYPSLESWLTPHFIKLQGVLWISQLHVIMGHEVINFMKDYSLPDTI